MRLCQGYFNVEKNNNVYSIIKIILCIAHVFCTLSKTVAEAGNFKVVVCQIHLAILNAKVNSLILLKIKNIGQI